jgi:hypothetical protein
VVVARVPRLRQDSKARFLNRLFLLIPSEGEPALPAVRLPFAGKVVIVGPGCPWPRGPKMQVCESVAQRHMPPGDVMSQRCSYHGSRGRASRWTLPERVGTGDRRTGPHSQAAALLSLQAAWQHASVESASSSEAVASTSWFACLSAARGRGSP